MNSIDAYKTIDADGEAIFKDKGSKFLGFAFHVQTEDEVKIIQKKLRKKYFDARHHVYAFRLGPEENFYRASDDGEPANSSGPPVLGQIKSFELFYTLVVVVRYFGGTKLGIPGLINAYKSAAQMAIQNAHITERLISKVLRITFPYELMNDVMKLASQCKLETSERIFEQNVTFSFLVAASSFDDCMQKFEKLHKLVIL